MTRGIVHPLLIMAHGRFAFAHPLIDDQPDESAPRLMKLRFAEEPTQRKTIAGLFDRSGPLDFQAGPYEESTLNANCTMEFAWFMTMHKAAVRLPADPPMCNTDIHVLVTRNLVAMDFRHYGFPVRCEMGDCGAVNGTADLPNEALVAPIFYREAGFSSPSNHALLNTPVRIKPELDLLYAHLKGPSETWDDALTIKS